MSAYLDEDYRITRCSECNKQTEGEPICDECAAIADDNDDE